MQGTESETITFEQPLNERVRTVMRLEHLFEQARFGVDGDTVWHSRLAVATLGEILDIFGRGDLKTELMKELKRVLELLHRLEERPGVDTARLAEVTRRCEELTDRLGSHTGPLGSALRQDDLLATVLQRAGIAGGTCAFDLPRYHRWLSRPAAARRADLEGWLASIELVREATETILGLLRDSAIPVECRAEGGMYQRTLDRNSAHQLVRVELPRSSAMFPEISGTRMFITIRFMSATGDQERPQQEESDVDFILQLCAL